MKVQIREIRSGKIKTVAKRFADILVKTKAAEYYETGAAKNTYQTKVMTADIASTVPVRTPINPLQETETDTSETAPNAEQASLETDEKPLDSEQETADNAKTKRRGRPAKKTGKTKAMTAKD